MSVLVILVWAVVIGSARRRALWMGRLRVHYFSLLMMGALIKTIAFVPAVQAQDGDPLVAILMNGRKDLHPGETRLFRGVSKDSDEDGCCITARYWFLDDELQSAPGDQDLHHTFWDEGAYKVTYYVVDDEMQWARADVTVIVQYPSPAPPLLEEPGNAAVLSDTTASLSWYYELCPGADCTPPRDGFQVEVSRNASFTDVVASATDLGPGTYAHRFVGLQHEQTYYWHVRAFKGTALGEWSAARSFHTPAAPLPPPITISPWPKIAFGEVEQGRRSAREVTVTSRSGAAVEGWVTLSPGDHGFSIPASMTTYRADPRQFLTLLFAPPAIGEYQALLTFTYGPNPTDTLQVRLHGKGVPLVDNPPQAALAVYPGAADQGVGTEIRFDASASADADEQGCCITAYAWAIDGEALPAPGEAQLRHRFTAAGPHRLQLIVTDDDARAQRDTLWLDLDILPPPHARLALTPAQAYYFAGQSVTFDASASEDADEHGSSIDRYRWMETLPGEAALERGTDIMLRHTLPRLSSREARVTYTLEVTDDEGSTDTTMTTLTLYGTPARPASGRPSNVEVAGLRPTLQWQGTDPPETVYLVELDTTASFATTHRSVPDTAHAYTTPALAYGQRYYWRVRGDNPAGVGPWSETWSFTTPPPPPVPIAEVQPSWHDFGQITVNSRSTVVLRVRNVGQETLNGMVRLVGDGAFGLVRGGGAYTAAEAATHEVEVSFVPTGEATYAARLEVTNAADGTVVEVDLKGRGMQAVVPADVRRYYYLKDHLGSIRVTLDDTGRVVHTDDYYPFGLQMPGRSYTEGDAAPAERFTGHELDDETGLLYAGARYLDPLLAQWLTPDPLAHNYPAWNPYNYVMGNPLTVIDPSGKDTVWVIDQSQRPRDDGTPGTSYTAFIFIEQDGGVVGKYLGSTFPNSLSNEDNSTKYNTIREGVHVFNNQFGHKGGSEKGLNLVDEEGNRLVLGVAPDGSTVEMKYVNVHKGASDRGNSNSRGSQGCITICPKDSDNFFGHFNFENFTTGTSTGHLILYRGGGLIADMKLRALESAYFMGYINH